MARSSRFIWAVMKNHALLHNARMLRATLRGIGEVQHKSKVFSHTVYGAVWFSYIANIVKAMENRGQVASIWYVLRVDQATFKGFLRDNPFDVSDLEEICRKLKLIRDKSHFHIDRDWSANDSFREAALPWVRVDALVDYLYEYLTYLRTVDIGCTGLTDHGYGQRDAALAILAVEKSETCSIYQWFQHQGR